MLSIYTIFVDLFKHFLQLVYIPNRHANAPTCLRSPQNINLDYFNNSLISNKLMFIIKVSYDIMWVKNACNLSGTQTKTPMILIKLITLSMT